MATENLRCAVLVDPQSPPEMAAFVLQVLRDEALRASLVARGLARAQEFSWERCATATLRVLEEVAAG